MAKDFNVYQWRRSHLTENQVSENNKSWKEEFKSIMDANDLTKGEIMDFVSIYFKDENGNPTMIGLNEDDKLKVSTIKFEDLDKTNIYKLPYGAVEGSWLGVLDTDKLENWRERFLRVYGDAELTPKGDKFIPTGNEKWNKAEKSGPDAMRSSGPLD